MLFDDEITEEIEPIIIGRSKGGMHVEETNARRVR